MNPIRNGNFSSSEIWKLTTVAKDRTSFGKPALDYIAEKNFERLLQRTINTDNNAKPLWYGKLVEGYVFNLLGTDYKLSSEETSRHPEIPFWVGSADGFKFDEGRTVYDIKAMWTLKSFCTMAKCKTIEEVREEHPDGEKYYFQLISNAIINDCKYAELIYFAPYKSEVKKIRESTEDFDGDANRVAFINWMPDEDFPWIPDGGHYKNVNIIRFEVPEIDKIKLTERVIEAGKLLIPIIQTQPA